MAAPTHLHRSAPELAGRPMADLVRLDGRVAVVTGAARGIGRAIADRLSEAGAIVLLADRDGAAVVAAAAAVGARSGTRAIGVRADVGDTGDLQRLADQAVAQAGGLDVWVNNAGIFPDAHPIDADRETIAEILDVNVIGTHIGCQVAARQMVQQGGGVIVNVASTAAFRGAGAYAASKWAVRGLTQGLAARLGPKGVRVVAVAPTAVVTPGIEEALLAGGDRMERYFDRVVDQLPLGRPALPDDIARTVLFLASDAAAFITGVTLPVDGGELAV